MLLDHQRVRLQDPDLGLGFRGQVKDILPLLEVSVVFVSGQPTSSGGLPHSTSQRAEGRPSEQGPVTKQARSIHFLSPLLPAF